MRSWRRLALTARGCLGPAIASVILPASLSKEAAPPPHGSGQVAGTLRQALGADSAADFFFDITIYFSRADKENGWGGSAWGE